MKVLNFTKETLTKVLIERISDIDSRERIILKMPFSCEVNRIEIYCSETEVKGMNEYFGEKFSHTVTLQQFNDYSNKAYSKTSYSYKNELLQFIPKLVDSLFAIIEKATK